MTRAAVDLGALLAALRGSGLRIGVEETLRLERVFSLSPVLDEAGLREVVGSVVVKSQEEREAFRSVFNAWFERAGKMAEPKEEEAAEAPLVREGSATGAMVAEKARPPKRRRKWLGWGLGAGSVALSLGLGLGFGWKALHPPVEVPAVIPSATPPVVVPSATPVVDPVLPPVVVPDSFPKTFLAPVPRVTVTKAPVPASLGLEAAALALLSGLGTWLLFGRKPVLPAREAPATPPGSRGARPRVAPRRRAGPELLDAAAEEALVWGIGRFVSEEATGHLELSATVRATAEAAGCPDLRFVRARHVREVQLWVDESADDPGLARVASELMGALRRAGLPVEEATFWAVPDRLRRSDGVELRPSDLDERRDATLVLVLTDGRLLGKLHDAEGERQPLDRLLRELSIWPRLGFVDFSEGATGLRALLKKHGIPWVLPDRAAAFLAAEAELPPGRQARRGRDDATLLWAAACALCPEAVDEEAAFALRRSLGVGPSPWGLQGLGGAVEGAGGRWAWPRRRRAELLRWLVGAGKVEKATAFWGAFYRKAGEALGEGWRESAEGRLVRMREAVVRLWGDPVGAAGELHSIFEGEVAELIREQLGWMGPKGEVVGAEGVELPWAMKALEGEVAARVMLEQMGLGAFCGVTPKARLRRSARVWASVGVCAGVLGATMGAQGILMMIPPVVGWRNGTKARFDLVRKGQRAWTLSVETAYVHDEIPLGPGEEVTVDDEEKEIACAEELEEGGVIWRCGRRKAPPRAAGWPQRSVAVLEGKPEDAGVRELGMRLLETGSVDVVGVGENWRTVICEVTQERWRTEKDQLIVVQDGGMVFGDLKEVCKGESYDHNAAIVNVGKSGFIGLAANLSDFVGAREIKEVWEIEKAKADGAVRVVGQAWESMNLRENTCPETMVWIPGGSFHMGSEDGNINEKPIHLVKIEGYCLDRAEVTVERYRKCAMEGKCDTRHLNEYSSLDGTTFTASPNCNYETLERENHPINCVSWTQADAYCKAGGNRLPSEEEWEYAARGGSKQRTYPWGKEAPSSQLCWNGDGSDKGKGTRESTCAVGNYPAGNALWGICDMAGNVWEWTSSHYCTYTQTGTGDNCNLGIRVFRGGSWFVDDASYVRAAYRSSRVPAGRFNSVGFRCARTPQ